MYIITQGTGRFRKGMSLKSFDILTDEVGSPLKFSSEGEAWSFLEKIARGTDWDLEVLHDGEIKVDHLH
tara:strand:+ start:292 stop:498 length:207 start_codon:yes stop_codon:yes gene_type:complete